MTRRQSKPRYVEIESASYWHHYYLYRDQEFKEEIALLKKELISKYGAQVTFQIPFTHDHFHMSSEDEGKIKNLANKYKTNNWGITFYADGLFEKGQPINPSLTRVDIDSDGSVVIVVEKNTTLEHIQMLWPWVESYKQARYKQKSPKSKAPERPDLVYAIHKQRRKPVPTSFKEIFQLYESGELDSYSGKPILKSEDSLERYFHRYEPKADI